MDRNVAVGSDANQPRRTSVRAVVVVGMLLPLVPLLASCGRRPSEDRSDDAPSSAVATQVPRALPRQAGSAATRSARPRHTRDEEIIEDHSPQSSAGFERVTNGLERNGPHPLSTMEADSEVAPQADADPFPDGSWEPAPETLSAAIPSTQSTVVPERLAVAGIRKLEGTHLTLYTDVPSTPEVDELPQVFDLAIEPWCKYFRVDPKRVKSWRMTGCLMQRREPFASTGLLPAELPPFLNGYQRGGELWVYEQPSDYYRRHLLLHEGTHAFMQWQLNGVGPPWYMEGMAELMGTHRWKDGQLQLAYFPPNRNEVEQWGRIKMVRTEFDEGRGLSLEQIAAYGPTAHLKNEPYGWCWGASAFLDGHPDYSRRFRQLPALVRDEPSRFAAKFERMYAGDRRRLDEQWQLFVSNLEYGYDLQREAITYEPVASRSRDTVTATIRADRGWQSTGVQIHAGSAYRLRATGRYQIDTDPRVWWCEPGGVTIGYHRGLPLGLLVAAVSDQTLPLSGVTPLANPEPIGLEREMEFTQSGTLFLRINDSPSQLADNAGQLSVEVEPVERSADEDNR